MKRSPRLQLSIENRILLPFVGISLLTMVAFLGLFLRNEYTKAVSAATSDGEILTQTLRRELILSCIEEQRYIILMGIAVLLIIVQTSVLIAYNISAPLRDLAEVCTRISLDPRSPEADSFTEYTRRTDETGQLANAFRLMMLSIRQYMDQINWIRALNEGIVENLPLGVLVYDGGKNMIFRNPRAYAMLNQPEATDEIGRSLEDILQEMILRDEVLPLRATLKDPAGRMRFLELAFWQLPAEEKGGPPGILCTIDDQTYQRRMEEKLNRDEKLAYTGKLAADVAHEAKNPLTGIRTGLQVIEKHLETDRDRQLCQGMISEVDRVSLLINNLVNLARQRESLQTTLLLNELLDEIALLYSKVAENKGIRLYTKTAGSIWILADEQQLRQILINLINNSIKALPEGGDIRIEAEMRTRGGTAGPAEEILLSVTDNGTGMSQEKLRSVMNGESGGFGLTIAARLAEQNNGTLRLSSEEGKGTRAELVFRGQKETVPENTKKPEDRYEL